MIEWVSHLQWGGNTGLTCTKGENDNNHNHNHNHNQNHNHKHSFTLAHSGGIICHSSVECSLSTAGGCLHLIALQRPTFRLPGNMCCSGTVDRRVCLSFDCPHVGCDMLYMKYKTLPSQKVICFSNLLLTEISRSWDTPVRADRVFFF